MENTSQGVKHNPENLYTPASFVMLRVPLLDVALYDWAFGESPSTPERLSELCTNPMFSEMLSLASPLLASRVRVFQDTPNSFSPKRARDLARSVAKYLVRATTRSTPFGAFAGVGIASLENSTAIELESPPIQVKYARLDYQAILQIVHKLERDPELTEHLNLYANPALYCRGDRAILAYRDSYGQGEPGEQISVRAAPPLLNVLSWVRTPQRYFRLLSHLQSLYPTRGRQELDSFLQSLIEQRILLSTLRPPLNEPDPFDYLQRVLPREYRGQLWTHINSLKSALNDYNSMPLGAGTRSLGFVVNRAQAVITPLPTCVQVDVALRLKASAFPRVLAEEVSQAISTLLRTTTPGGGVSALRYYAREFLERYGEDREVPLLELLDDEVGLGPPPSYSNPRSRRRWPEARIVDSVQRKDWLARNLGEALASGSQEIHLEAAGVEELPLEMDQLHTSMDVFINVAAASTEALDRGQYHAVLGPRGAVFPAGRAIGRFAHLDPAIRKHLNTIADQDVRQHPDVVLADLIYTHPRGHANNVSIHPITYPYQIAVATTPGVPFDRHISLSDLLVSVRGEQFYLWSKTVQKRVLVRALDMLSPLGAPNVVRFLLEVSASDSPRDIFWTWGDFESMPFLPRVSFGRVVFSPARWRLPRRLRSLSNEDWVLACNDWRKQLRVPRYVYVSDSDNRLLLDLDHPLHQEIIKQHLSQGKEHIEEPLPSLDDAPIRDSNGSRYMLEAVISLVLTPPHAIVSSPPRARVESKYSDRITLPGEGCLYAKLYGPRSMQDDVIIAVKAQIDTLNPASTDWFFVRYADPDDHLRIRFLGEAPVLWGRFLSHLCHGFRQLHTRGLVTRVALDSYDREIERYGGYKGMAVCEAVFSSDSETIVSLMKFYRADARTLEWDNLVLLSLDALLRGLGFDRNARAAIYKAMSGRRVLSADKAANSTRKRLHPLLAGKRTTIWNYLRPSWLLSQPNGGAVVECLRELRESLAQPGKTLFQLGRNDELSTPTLNIGASLGHMHMNRAGIDPQREHELAFMFSHVYDGFMKYIPQDIEV